MRVGERGGGLGMGVRSRGDAVTLSVSPGWAGGVSSVEVFGLVSSSR